MKAGRSMGRWPRARLASITLLVVTTGTTLLPAPVAMAAGGKQSACPGRKACPDTTAPTVSVATPAPGATVGGMINVAGTAADNVSVARVEVAVDDGVFQLASGTTNWSRPLDTTAHTNATHTIRARATDTSGNTTTASVTVTVANTLADAAPPTVSIGAPSAGATVAGTITVSGTANDDVSVAAVAIQVDGEAFQPASGTTAWSRPLDTTAYGDGSHTITARAHDSAGNERTASVVVAFSNPAPSGTKVSDPNASNLLWPLGRGRMAEWGSVTAVLYGESGRKAVYLRDVVTGATSFVTLPTDSAPGWNDMSYAMTAADELWVQGGQGPIYVRRYRLSGSPLPTTATLLATQTFGDSDSRWGDLVRLASGGLVSVWHQQGWSGAPQSIGIAYRPPGGSWQVLPYQRFMPTASSKQIAVQHPADGSVWVFNDPDAYGQIGAMRLVESPGALSVAMTDNAFVTTAKYGSNGPDPENPDLAAAADPSTGTIVLAYQSADRQILLTDPVRTGSRVAIARVTADASVTFEPRLLEWVERISGLGLVVRPGEVWLAYRPIDTTDWSFDDLYAAVYRNGSWQPRSFLGTLYTAYGRAGYGTSRAEFSAMLSDGLHFFPGA